MTTVAAVSSVLAGWAPTEWAESWDNVGLLVGDPGAAVGRVLVALDVTDDVLDEAERLGAEMIVAFHPPLFAPLSRVRADEAESRVIWRAVAAGLALYATHTSLDSARPGTSDFLAEALGLGPTLPLRPAAEDSERGLGRLGELPAPVALGALTAAVAEVTGAAYCRLAGDPQRAVRRVAVLGGSGASFVAEAAAAGAEVLITGDAKHHDALDAERRGLALIDPGHGPSEKFVVERTAAFLAAACPEVLVDESNATVDPFARGA